MPNHHFYHMDVTVSYHDYGVCVIVWFVCKECGEDTSVRLRYDKESIPVTIKRGSKRSGLHGHKRSLRRTDDRLCLKCFKAR